MEKVLRANLAIAVIFLIIKPNYFYSQYNPTIRTGRPGQAIGAFTVGKKILQLQQGVDYYGQINTVSKPQSYVSNNVIRYGIKETIELSALVDYQNDSYKIKDTTYSYNGLSNLHVGFRAHLTDQNGIIPSTCFQMRLKMPSISKEYGTAYVAPAMNLVANWRLNSKLGLCTNWILVYSGNNEVPTGKYVLNFNFPLSEKWSGFVENYGQLRKDIFETRFDAGLAYLANNNVQFDVYGGYGDNFGIRDFFVSAGISWRLNFNKNKNK